LQRSGREEARLPGRGNFSGARVGGGARGIQLSRDMQGRACGKPQRGGRVAYAQSTFTRPSSADRPAASAGARANGLVTAMPSGLTAAGEVPPAPST